MRFKALLMDEPAIVRAVTRMSHEILERNKGIQDLVLLGILRRGVPLAEMIRDHIQAIEGVTLPCGALDIRYYRDDLTLEQESPRVRLSPLPFAIRNQTVVLVDDVLYTGRTTRAALNEIFDYGRPASVRLAVLVDRGGRQLPIEAEYAAARLLLPAGQSLALARADDGSFSFRLKPSKS